MNKFHRVLALKNQMLIAKHQFRLRGKITVFNSANKINAIIDNVKAEYIKASSDRLNYLYRNSKGGSVKEAQAGFKNLFVANKKMKTGVNKFFNNEREKKVYFKTWYSGYQNERSQYMAFFKP